MKLQVRILQFAKRPVGETTYAKLAALLTGFVALVGLFGYIAREVEEGETKTRDTEILLKINAHSSSVLDTVALAVTYSGNLLTVLSMTTLLVALLVRKRLWRSVVQVVATMGGALIANALLKLLFQRERPELWQLLTHESTYSFPSGHALLTAAFATLITLLAWKTKFRWVVLVVASLYSLCVGLSRLYLGVHYPTDVLAGWCLGIAWALGVATILGVVRLKVGLNRGRE